MQLRYLFSLLLTLVLSMSIPSDAQASDNDELSTNPMVQLFQMHYENRVKAFRSESTNMNTVVLLGDSITEGFDVAKWFPFRRVLNRGIGADVIGVGLRKGDRRGVLKRLDVSVFDCCTSHVFLLIGINDLGDNRPHDLFLEGYREILQQIKTRSPAVTVHVQSLLPTSRGFAKHNENIVKLNAELRKMAEEFDYPFLDLHPHFSNKAGELKEEFTNDGLHINDAAYAVWKSQIERVMNW